MNRSAIALLVALAGGSAAPAAAQQQPPVTTPTVIEFQDAARTRDELQEILRQHPQNVTTVLRADSSLVNPDYLAPYPALVNFIKLHPEVTRNPSYFFGTPDFRQIQGPRNASAEVFEQVMEGFTVLLVTGAIIGVFTWLLRFFVEHRRWLRTARTQTEVHTKLLDRLSNNEDLMAYMNTAAGKRFLESAPIALDAEPRAAVAAPLSRILWSLQAGVVLASLGVGFFLAQGRFPDDMGEGFYIIGMLVAALGIGFALSAVLAWVVSARFGLFGPPATPRPSTND